VRGTIEKIARDLVRDGFVQRYNTSTAADGLPPGEGVFLPCSFWLADNYVLLGQKQAARKLFEKLLRLRNDVGLLAEEYSPENRRLLGNFPQAFSHVALINTALNISRQHGPAGQRAKRDGSGKDSQR
jgi:GH15 family glucan-1,4-alpha-glucosidase